ncbi:MAG TPA: hypothetical protein VFW33_10150 [Gemmataceae bacterium]|nr:hypothetical protein [Gemmataceae bacterium]
MTTLRALGSGLAGALALTAVHETARRALAGAPRMDVLGMRGIARSLEAVGQTPPEEGRLHELALAGDILSNSLYYSMVGVGGPEGAWLRGALLGLAAGVGAVLLPGPLGLGEAPSNRTPATRAMTVGWYLLGGLAAAAACRLMARGGDRGPET